MTAKQKSIRSYSKTKLELNLKEVELEKKKIPLCFFSFAFKVSIRNWSLRFVRLTWDKLAI